jgi:hypothetical protein
MILIFFFLYFYVNTLFLLFISFQINMLTRYKKKKEIRKESWGKRIRQEDQEIKSQARIIRRKESVKNTRTQESCLARHFLPRQTRFCLQEYHKNVQIWLFRQESCVEGMAKESWLITKKIKNLERREARSSTSVLTYRDVKEGKKHTVKPFSSMHPKSYWKKCFIPSL